VSWRRLQEAEPVGSPAEPEARWPGWSLPVTSVRGAGTRPLRAAAMPTPPQAADPSASAAAAGAPHMKRQTEGEEHGSRSQLAYSPPDPAEGIRKSAQRLTACRALPADPPCGAHSRKRRVILWIGAWDCPSRG